MCSDKNEAQKEAKVFLRSRYLYLFARDGQGLAADMSLHTMRVWNPSRSLPIKELSMFFICGLTPVDSRDDDRIPGMFLTA